MSRLQTNAICLNPLLVPENAVFKEDIQPHFPTLPAYQFLGKTDPSLLVTFRTPLAFL